MYIPSCGRNSSKWNTIRKPSKPTFTTHLMLFELEEQPVANYSPVNEGHLLRLTKSESDSDAVTVWNQLSAEAKRSSIELQ